MRRTIYQLSFVLMICLTLTGCKNVFLGLYGMKMPKAVNEKKILRYGKKYHIPEEDSYQLDTITYNAFLHHWILRNLKPKLKTTINRFRRFIMIEREHLNPFRSIVMPEVFQTCIGTGTKSLKRSFRNSKHPSTAFFHSVNI